MSGPEVNWDEVHGRLVAEFKECRARASVDIDRMRKVVNALIACRWESSREIQIEDFEVKDLVNELRTVERYIKREVARLSPASPTGDRV